MAFGFSGLVIGKAKVNGATQVTFQTSVPLTSGQIVLKIGNQQVADSIVEGQQCYFAVAQSNAEAITYEAAVPTLDADTMQL